MKRMLTAWALVLLLGSFAAAAEKVEGIDQSGPIELKSAGLLAFGPDGVLFVGDARGAMLYALHVPAGPASPASSFKIENITAKVAEALKAQPADVSIVDLAVQPGSNDAYLSVDRKGGQPALVKVTAKGIVSPVDLSKANYAKIEIANAPDADAKDRRGRSLRDQAITDLAYVDARVYIAGLSKDEPTSTMRVVEFPFTAGDTSTEIEIYHGAHGKYETDAPVRTFVPLMFGGEPHLLAAYTCTPLVKIPVSELKSKKGEKLRGTTIAELGNRNQPLDIIAYKKGDAHYLLLANSARGVMKITTENIDNQEGITKRIDGTAGLKYETVSSLTGVEQLDKLGEDHALLLQKQGDALALVSIELP